MCLTLTAYTKLGAFVQKSILMAGPHTNDEKARIISLILFRLGQLVLIAGYMTFMIGIATAEWVVRPGVDYAAHKVDPTVFDVVKHFGIFSACKQKEDSLEVGACGSIQSYVNFVDGNAIRLVQALMVMASMLYLAGFILELLQVVPVPKVRNFLAENRVVEMLSSIATVLGLVGMVIYAGEIKNKAELVPGQEDEEVGWSFTTSIVGLSLSVLGLMTVTMFRHLPDLPGESESGKGGSWLRVKRDANNEIH